MSSLETADLGVLHTTVSRVHAERCEKHKTSPGQQLSKWKGWFFGRQEDHGNSNNHSFPTVVSRKASWYAWCSNLDVQKQE